MYVCNMYCPSTLQVDCIIFTYVSRPSVHPFPFKRNKQICSYIYTYIAGKKTTCMRNLNDNLNGLLFHDLEALHLLGHLHSGISLFLLVYKVMEYNILLVFFEIMDKAMQYLKDAIFFLLQKRMSHIPGKLHDSKMSEKEIIIEVYRFYLLCTCYTYLCSSLIPLC